MRDIYENLRKSVVKYDINAAAKWTRIAIEEKSDPVKAADALAEGLRQVGDGFGCGDLFLPDLVMAAEVVKNTLPVLEEEIKRRGEKKKTTGKLVIGSVKGDIHDIGKMIVATLFMANGFEVIDLGVDVPTEDFVQAIRDHEPDILGISALMTVTASEMTKVIASLTKSGLREKVRIIVGGGALNRRFAEHIGADGYAEDAIEAVKEARRILGIR